MENVELKVGQTYRINHSRKGSFVAKITGVNGEWAHGVVVSGKASAMLDYNVCEPGDDVSMRISHIRSAKVLLNA